jgi:hypothetical protein
VTVSLSAPTVATGPPQALPSTQQEGDLARQVSLADIWEIVGGILLGFIAVCLLVLTAYYWKRRRDTRLKMTAPSRKFTFTCLNVRRKLPVVMLNDRFIALYPFDSGV